MRRRHKPRGSDLERSLGLLMPGGRALALVEAPHKGKHSHTTPPISGARLWVIEPIVCGPEGVIFSGHGCAWLAEYRPRASPTFVHTSPLEQHLTRPAVPPRPTPVVTGNERRWQVDLLGQRPSNTKPGRDRATALSPPTLDAHAVWPRRSAIHATARYR